MYEKSVTGTLQRFRTVVPAVFREAISTEDTAHFLRKFSTLFSEYKENERSTTAINVVHFHHLFRDGNYQDVVLDYIGQITKSNAFDFSTDLLGRDIAYVLTISQLRVQYPTMPTTHVPLHQDLAFTGIDYPVLNLWVPLVDCGESAPGLEFIDRFVDTDLTHMVEEDKTDSVNFAAIDLDSREAFLRERYGGEVINPILKAGDAMVFDQFALHRTAIREGMTRPRYSLELRGFAAEHMFADPDRWLRDRVNGEIIVATRGRDAAYLSHKSVSRVVSPKRERFQTVPERDRPWETVWPRVEELLETIDGDRTIGRQRTRLPAFFESQPFVGRCLLYPLGADTRLVLPIAAATPGLTVLGVVDRRGDSLPPHEGHEVIAPERLADIDYDAILLCHLVPEQARQLTEQLVRAGVPQGKIVDVYADPRLDTLTARTIREEAAALKAIAPVERVILCGERGLLMGEGDIRELFPVETTVVLTVTGAMPARMEGYRAISAAGSIAAAEIILRELAPRLVMVRSSVNEHFYGAIARRALPDVKLVHEMYDLWVSLAEMPVERLAAVFGIDARRYELNRLSEEHSLLRADLIISKRFGAGWNETFPDPNRNYVPYFPLVEPRLIETAVKSPGPAAKGDRPLAFVDATWLMPHDAVQENPDVLISYAPFEMMETIAALEPVTFDVYNGYHREEARDRQFDRYLRRYDRGAIHYHRGMPVEDLIPRLGEFDYGWINVAVPFGHPDAPFVALNRFTSYAVAGLPVFVSARLEMAAALVERFDAGVVVADYTVDATRAALRRVDPDRHRRGVLALREHMLRENRRAIERIREHLG